MEFLFLWKCRRAARSRKGAAQRNLVRDPAQRSAAQRLITALRQDGSALRAKFMRWTPDTLPLSLQGSGDVPQGGTLVPGTCRRAALGFRECREGGTWVPGMCRGAALGFRGRAAKPHFESG